LAAQCLDGISQQRMCFVVLCFHECPALQLYPSAHLQPLHKSHKHWRFDLASLNVCNSCCDAPYQEQVQPT
jgi:hypothetical protein